MAFGYFDRVKETTTTTGTGVITLAGAVPSFRAFSAVYVNADTLHYTVVDPATGAWEVGLGTWLTGNQLQRTAVLASSNANAAVNFAAGTKSVFVCLPASMAAAFIRADGAVPMAADLNLGTHKATGMSPGAVGTDGVNKNQLDAVATAALQKDGSNAATGNLNAGGFQVTNAANAGSATALTTLQQVTALIAAAGVSSWNGRTGAVVPANGDFVASQVTNDSGVTGATVAAALNTLNAAIDLTGARVVAGPANTFLAGGSPNSWKPTFTGPASPGDNGKTVIASGGDFTYLSPGTAGNMLSSNGTAWVAGVDFAALSPVTTAGFLANSSTGFIRLGLVSGSGSGVASAASVGSIRGARGASGFTVNVRNNADSADLTLITTDTTSGPTATFCSTAASGFSPVIAAPSAGTITLRVGSSATQMQLTTTTVSLLIPTLNFFTSVATPVIQQQSDATNGVTGKKLVMNAQDCGGTTSTGGDLDYRPGSGTTAGGKGRLMSGGGAVASAQRLAWNDTGVGLYTTAPVAQAARVGQFTDATTGTPSTTIGDVGAIFSQSTLNNIHASFLAKANAIELLIHNIGMSA